MSHAQEAGALPLMGRATFRMYGFMLLLHAHAALAGVMGQAPNPPCECGLRRHLPCVPILQFPACKHAVGFSIMIMQPHSTFPHSNNLAHECSPAALSPAPITLPMSSHLQGAVGWRAPLGPPVFAAIDTPALPLHLFSSHLQGAVGWRALPVPLGHWLSSPPSSRCTSAGTSSPQDRRASM